MVYTSVYQVSLFVNQVRGTDTIYQFLLPEAVYKLVVSVSMNSYHGTSVYQVSLLEDQP